MSIVLIPWKEDALHHIEVLHQHVPLGLGAQVAHGVVDAQHDGPFQGRRRGLTGGLGEMEAENQCLSNWPSYSPQLLV